VGWGGGGDLQYIVIILNYCPTLYWIHELGIDYSPNVSGLWYLGLGMRYGDGTCAILISKNGAFK